MPQINVSINQLIIEKIKKLSMSEQAFIYEVIDQERIINKIDLKQLYTETELKHALSLISDFKETDYEHTIDELDKLQLKKIISKIDKLIELINRNSLYEQVYVGNHDYFLDSDSVDLTNDPSLLVSYSREYSISLIAAQISSFSKKMSLAKGHLREKTKLPWEYLDHLSKWIDSNRDNLSNIADIISVSLPVIKEALESVLNNSKSINLRWKINSLIDGFLKQNTLHIIEKHLKNIDQIDLDAEIGRAALFGLVQQVGELTKNLKDSIPDHFWAIKKLRDSIHLLEEGDGTGRNYINFVIDPRSFFSSKGLDTKDALKFFENLVLVLKKYQEYVGRINSAEETSSLDLTGIAGDVYKNFEDIIKSKDCFGIPLGDSNFEISASFSSRGPQDITKLINTRLTKAISLTRFSIEKINNIVTSDQAVQNRYATIFYITTIGQAGLVLNNSNYQHYPDLEIDLMLECIRWLRNSLMHQHEFDVKGYLIEYFANPLNSASFLQNIERRIEDVSGFLSYFDSKLITLREKLQAEILSISKPLKSHRDKYYKFLLEKKLEKSFADEASDDLIIIQEALGNRGQGIDNKANSIMMSQNHIKLEDILSKEAKILELCNDKKVKIEGIFGKIAYFGYASQDDSSGIIVKLDESYTKEEAHLTLSQFRQKLDSLLNFRFIIVKEEQLKDYLMQRNSSVLNGEAILKFIVKLKDNYRKIKVSFDLYKEFEAKKSEYESDYESIKEKIKANLSEINYNLILGPDNTDSLIDIIIEKFGFSFIINNNIAQYLDLNSKDKYGTTLLHKIAMDGTCEQIAFLLENNNSIDLDVENINGNTALDLAVQYHKQEIAKLLIDRGAAVELRFNGQSALHEAAFSGNFEMVSYIFDKYPTLNVNQWDNRGFLPIHRALYILLYKNYASHLPSTIKVFDISNLFIEEKTNDDSEEQDNFDSENLSEANYPENGCPKDNAINIIRFLIQKGSRGDQIYDNNKYISPIHWVYNNFPELFTTIVLNSDNFNYIEDGSYPLHLATERANLNEDHRAAFNYVVSHSNSLNVFKDYEYPALAIAIRARDLESVKILVEAGAYTDYDNGSHDDLILSSIEIVRYLVGKGKAVNFQDFNNDLNDQHELQEFVTSCLSLINAVEGNDIQSLLALETQEIPLTLRFWVINQPLMKVKAFSLGDLAIKKGSVDIVRYFSSKQLISKNSLPESEPILINLDNMNSQLQSYKQYSEIIKGIYSGDLNLLKKAKKENINSNITFIYKGIQGTILHLAIQKNNEQAVTLIVNKWPLSVNYPDKLYGSVPLIAAIKGKNENIITLVLAQTIKEHNFFPSNARSILEEEVLYKHPNSLGQIFASLTELDKNRINQEVIFHNFIDDENKVAEIAVNILLKYGIDVNYQGYQGNTALHIACKYNSPKIAMMLLSNKHIDPNIINDLGYTPLHLASLKGNKEVVEVLLSNRNVDKNACVYSGWFWFSTGLTDALDLALESGHYEFAKALVRHGIKLNKNVAIVILYALKYKDSDFLEEFSNVSQVLDKEDLGNFIYNWRSKHFSLTDYKSILQLLEDQAIYNKIPTHIGKALKSEVQNEILKSDDEYSTSVSDNSNYESSHLVRFEKVLKVTGFKYLSIGYNKEILIATEASASIILFSESHHIQHKYNIESIAQIINNDNFNANTVICIERKQYDKNFGIPDVITLAQLLERSIENDLGLLSILQQQSPVYYDAMLYNIAKAKGISVIGIEGKGLVHSKESPYYHQTREKYMAEQLVAIARSEKNAIFLVGSSHVSNLIKLLREQGFRVEGNDALLDQNLVTMKSEQVIFTREPILSEVSTDLVRITNYEHKDETNSQPNIGKFVAKAAQSYSFFSSIHEIVKQLNLNWQLQKLLHFRDLWKFSSLKVKYKITTSFDIFRDSDSKFRKSVLLKFHPDKNSGKQGSNDDFTFVTNLREEINKPFDVQKYLDGKVKAIQPIIYKANIGFKAFDTAIDVTRLVYVPTIENTKKVLIDTTYLYNMFSGVNSFSVIINGIDVSYKVYQGEYIQALTQTLKTTGYMLTPAAISFVAIPYVGFMYGATLTIYSGYSAINNAYSFYQEYNSVEWQLKSVIANKDMSEFLANSPLQQIYDFAVSSKNYEIKVNAISLEVEKAQIKQQLETKGEFGAKLYNYIYMPMLEEKYTLLNNITNRELTKEQTEILKAKHVSMTIENQYYQHCMEIIMLKEEEAKHYYCYNEEQQILDHILIGEDRGYVEVIERL